MIPTLSPSKKTILCMDDDAAILRYETALLERAGYAVLTAASRLQGLRLVATCYCDAVLLDYEMAGMNGHDIAFQIKLLKAELIVILLFGQGSTDAGVSARRCFCAEARNKPPVAANDRRALQPQCGCKA